MAMAGPLRALLFEPAHSSLAAAVAHARANSSLASLVEPANSSLADSGAASLATLANSSLTNSSLAALSEPANSSLANLSAVALATPAISRPARRRAAAEASGPGLGPAEEAAGGPRAGGAAAGCLLWEGEGCDSLRDRGSCLGKRDGRPWASWDGLAVSGQPCAWCGGERCTVDGEALCMPHAWVAGRAGVSVANCSASETRESVAMLIDTELAGWDAAHDSIQFEQAAPGFRCAAEHASDSAGFNKFYWTFAAGSLAQCQGICSNKSYCRGFQYEDGQNECQVWWHAVQSIDLAVGDSDANFTCVRVAAVESSAGDADENETGADGSETNATTTHRGLTNAEKGIIGGTVGGVAAAGLMGGLLGGLLRATHTSTVTVTTTALLVDALLGNLTENASAGLILPGTANRGMLDGNPASDPAPEELAAGSRWGFLPAWAARPKLMGGVAVALVAGSLAALLAPRGGARGRAGAKSRAVEVEVEVVSDGEQPRHLEEGTTEAQQRQSLLGGTPAAAGGARAAAAWPAWPRPLAELPRPVEPLGAAALDGNWRSMFTGVFGRMARGGAGGQQMVFTVSPQHRAGPLVAARQCAAAAWAPSPAFVRVPLAEPPSAPPVPRPASRARLAEPSVSPPVPRPLSRVSLAEPSASPPVPRQLARAPLAEPLASPPVPRLAWVARR